MKKEYYKFPKSSFLSTEKDMSLISKMILDNKRLQKLLYWTTPDCLDKSNLSDDLVIELFQNNIKIVPKLIIDGSVLNYIIINQDNFTPSGNPEFRDCILEFDIICHFDQWKLKDFALRPYKIAAELDTMLNEKDLVGIGHLQFMGANQMILTDEYAGLCLMYMATHDGDDKVDALSDKENTSLINNFNGMFNQ